MIRMENITPVTKVNLKIRYQRQAYVITVMPILLSRKISVTEITEAWGDAAVR